MYNRLMIYWIKLLGMLWFLNPAFADEQAQNHLLEKANGFSSHWNKHLFAEPGLNPIEFKLKGDLRKYSYTLIDHKVSLGKIWVEIEKLFDHEKPCDSGKRIFLPIEKVWVLLKNHEGNYNILKLPKTMECS
ncbi:MAG: hypothetical protein HOE90_13320 [Bacteriovoracaceae bacterium]|nr:hypothetical protein [Bacteriovoracaceae bacterium]